MLKKLLRVFVSVVGCLIGPGIVYVVFQLISMIWGMDIEEILQSWAILAIYLGGAAVTGLIFSFLSKRIVNALTTRIRSVEHGAAKSSPAKVTAGIIGLIIGLVIAALLSLAISSIPTAWVAIPLTVACYIVAGALGWSLGYTGKFDLSTVIGKNKHNDKKKAVIAPKILDTSAVIDGRIYDILKTGVIEGTIIVPGFVVTELQHISDSADSLKRQKGRRGLDILNKMQQDFPKQIQVMNKDYEEVKEVDAKLIRLGVDLRGKVVTLDYNLNKVAQVYGVEVFNINELANAVKPVLLPGEELKTVVVKDGKEANQGIAYLDDGTMIVIDGAKGCAGEEKEVAVTSVLQTAAGRMIFAKVINKN